jgi:hypothetical protein
VVLGLIVAGTFRTSSHRFKFFQILVAGLSKFDVQRQLPCGRPSFILPPDNIIRGVGTTVHHFLFASFLKRQRIKNKSGSQPHNYHGGLALPDLKIGYPIFRLGSANPLNNARSCVTLPRPQVQRQASGDVSRQSLATCEGVTRLAGDGTAERPERFEPWSI